mgnify:CR=1 FL=1
MPCSRMMLPMRLLDAVTPLPFQGGLDLPGAVTLAAVAPDRAHVAGDRIRTLRPGTPGHPVTGGAGNVRYPASRRYRAAGGVGPYHACFVRIPAPLVLKRPPPSPTGGCAPSTRSARSAPACGCRPPWSNRCCGPPHPPVQGGTRDVALRPDLARGLAVLVQLHDPAFELLLIMTWTTRIGHDHQLLRCPALNKPSNTLEPIRGGWGSRYFSSAAYSG